LARRKRTPGLDFVFIQSPAWSVLGVSAGMPLAEVERLNGKPFTLVDYDGDLAGGVADWQGGRFDAPLPGGCRLGALFALARGADLNAWKAGSTGLVSSDDAGFRTANPRLSQLSVYFPKSEAGK
jgi:hypothetical protein